MNVQAANRRHDRVPKQKANAFIALPIGDHGIALVSGRMRARPEQTRAGPDNRATHLRKLSDRVAHSSVNTGDQLDLTGVQLRLDRSRDLTQSLEHRGRAVDLPARNRVDQKQLLLDPDRKRLPRAKFVLTTYLCCHDREVWRRSSTQPAAPGHNPATERHGTIRGRQPLESRPQAPSARSRRASWRGRSGRSPRVRSRPALNQRRGLRLAPSLLGAR
jgi:hypothetical protein